MFRTRTGPMTHIQTVDPEELQLQTEPGSVLLNTDRPTGSLELSLTDGLDQNQNQNHCGGRPMKEAPSQENRTRLHQSSPPQEVVREKTGSSSQTSRTIRGGPLSTQNQPEPEVWRRSGSSSSRAQTSWFRCSSKLLTWTSFQNKSLQSDLHKLHSYSDSQTISLSQDTTVQLIRTDGSGGFSQNN